MASATKQLSFATASIEKLAVVAAVETRAKQQLEKAERGSRTPR